MRKAAILVGALAMLNVNAFSQFTFSGDAGILGVKNTGGTTTHNNLDVLWGRINFVSNYMDSNFTAALHLRIYPAGYGFDYISGATFDPTTNAIVTTATNETKLQVIQGWAQYKLKSLKIKVGLMPLKYNIGFHFGDYAQRSYGGSYLYPGALHNATMFIHDVGILNSQVTLGVNQKNLNKAYLLVKETVKPMANLSSSVTFRSNIFDRVYDSKSPVTHALSFDVLYNYFKGQKVYAEVGVRELNNDSAKVHYPFTLGITVPTKGILDIATAEIEYSALRADASKPGLYWAAYVGKNLGKHCQLQTAVYTNSSGKKDRDLSIGAYFVSNFK